MPNFDFSSRDYDTIRSDLLARAARVFPEWTDRDPSDFGMLMVDLWAYMGDVMHYYIDRVAGEQFLPTATQRESVLALANLLDYSPRGRSSATATVNLSNSGNTDYVIDPLTEFIARSDNKTFQCYTPTGGTAPSGGAVDIPLYEGTLYQETLTGSSSGTVGQRYTLGQGDVVASSIQVFVYEDGVNPSQYLQVPRMTLAAAGERVFVANTTASGDLEVIFGTSLNGFIPPVRSRITVTYASSSGALGNLPANTVVGFKTTTPVGLTITASTAFSGGVDDESIDSLKRSIPSVIQAQNRAVTSDDFVALATQVAGVAKAAVSYAPGDMTHNASVTVYPQAVRGDYLTTADTSQTVSAGMQADVVAALQPRALLGVTVLSATSVVWTPIHISAMIFVNERAVATWVVKDVADAIDSLFGFDNVFFGQRVTLGQVYRLILNVDGVDYAQITRFSTALDSTVNTDILVNPLNLPKKGTITLSSTGGIVIS